MVKRRPANNRDPTAPEIEYYRHYLEEEIRLVDPAIIVLTGRHSMRTVLGKTEGITKIRGRWRDVEGRRVMPMFHPSYLLRNPYNTPKSPKALTWDDVQEVKRVVDELGIIESEVAPPAERADGERRGLKRRRRRRRRRVNNSFYQYIGHARVRNHERRFALTRRFACLRLFLFPARVAAPRAPPPSCVPPGFLA